ncbi:uroporphyrinogen decarboxylase family protein [Paludicola sp. MB14-C6]|uniref:uroporphyrinogen decarboxylase family protein n=1 Tax=Paludihabitans sp. MB14-C6 TaxID=3070656 RepID=UPI0027DD9073|nr:uroporphyrinogen decarboxylase family protein [Paludicola sp. MB14-C6]WMJ22814.1 uroporphyrinogen decarboxylase family protein [Paludicola sp. MB14-C6]
MNKRDNLLSLVKRQGYQKVPVEFSMCPSLEKAFNQYMQEHDMDIDFTSPWNYVDGIAPKPVDRSVFNPYYTFPLKEGTAIDEYGVGHEPGSAAAFHMTKMLHPMANFDSVEQILAYPFLDYSQATLDLQYEQVKKAHANGICAMGGMQCTIWETAWYMRGMENLMMDMMSDDEMATVLLDKVTDNAILRAEGYAKAGADIIFLGDDIGMQHSILMSKTLYSDWLKPRLKKVIDSAKAINNDIIFFYHSCGYVEPFIPDLIDVGIDVLNPVQPECMDFAKIHAIYGNAISFHGTIGTQTTMPFGTPDEVRREVFKNLDIAGEKGGLMVAPTHLLEPEVPVENLVAYIKACNDYK